MSFEREPTAAARHDVDRQVRMLPALELLATDVEGDVGDRPEIDVPLADPKPIASRSSAIIWRWQLLSTSGRFMVIVNTARARHKRCAIGPEVRPALRGS
jgi:hypothetical protein